MNFIRKKGKFYLISIFLISICIIIYFILNSPICKHLECLSFENRNQYKIEKNYEESKYLFRALYKKDNILLRIEIRTNSSPLETEQAIQTQLMRIKGLFANNIAPYPGEISNIISCNEKYKPIYSTKQQNGIQISFFSGFVNERLVFGSCTDDQTAYHDTLAIFYCEKQRKFYQLEVIIPQQDYSSSPGKYQQILDSIACKK